LAPVELRTSVEVSALSSLREINIELVEFLRDDKMTVQEQFEKISEAFDKLKSIKYLFDDE